MHACAFFVPDRHSGASEEVKKVEEKKFKEIGEAYSILSDAKKKARYDRGEDLDESGMDGFASEFIVLFIITNSRLSNTLTEFNNFCYKII